MATLIRAATRLRASNDRVRLAELKKQRVEVQDKIEDAHKHGRELKADDMLKVKLEHLSLDINKLEDKIRRAGE